MTQLEFAQRIGITQGHLSRIERGEKEAGATVLLAISRAFGKSVDWRLTEETKVTANCTQNGAQIAGGCVFEVLYLLSHPRC